MTTQFRSHNGEWRVASTERFETGQRVTVSRRNGQSSEVIITAHAAHDPARDLPHLYTFDDVRRASGAQRQAMNAEIGNVGRLFELFAHARENGARAINTDEVRRPVVRFELSNTQNGLRLEMRGDFELLALTGAPVRGGRRGVYGRLGRNGVFTGNVGGTQVELDIFNEVADVLRGFAADPAGYSAAHGRRTGQCCYCGRGLTDPRSVVVGYGPICADHFGLPWGEATDTANDNARNNILMQRAPIPMTREAAEEATMPRGVPTLEDIQNEPSAARRMAMAAQRASAGLPPLASRNARGELINAAATAIETATGADLDRWGAQYNVSRTITGASGLPWDRSDVDYRAAIIEARARMAGGNVVTASYRRQRPGPAVAPARQGFVRPARSPRVAAPTVVDETTSTVTRSQRRLPNSPIEEDDFIWPPRS